MPRAQTASAGLSPCVPPPRSNRFAWAAALADSSVRLSAAVGAATFFSAVLIAPKAEAVCTNPPAATTTCTGDESGGISFTNPPVGTLNVNSLTNDITPAAGVDGVSLTGNGADGGKGDDKIGKGDDGHTGDPGENVEINFDGTPFAINTSGSSAQGIIATANGGKGGEGGEGLDDVIDPVDTKGGEGGTGGAGGDVTVNSDGTIATTGSLGHGILAVSEAGDGGKGGRAQAAASSEGGNGGRGGAAGNVVVDNDGNISTTGSQAQGIYVQSIGGAGGDGGDSDGGIVGGGGAAKGGGPGGTATVTNSGAIDTSNSGANGILAQSVGGFSGNGGSGGGLFSYGASDQSAGSADTVIVNNSGAITTQSTFANAIMAQSTGGGGGSAGTEVAVVALGSDGASAGGAGGTVQVTNSAALSTNDDNSVGIQAQSIGGGGGDGGLSVGLVSIGGKSGTGGAGGAVSVDNSGTIATVGSMSDAILAQSIGGGGGHGGSGGGLVAIGGGGGDGGDGDTVTITNTGNLSTGGDHSNAILAQSIGGGGGKGGSSVAVGAFVSVAVGGSGGNGGAGGIVNVNTAVDANSAPTTIVTSGDHAGGIAAQSTGGGGGKGGWAVSVSGGPGFDLSVGKGGGGGSGGDSNTVTLHNNGVVSTAGNHADGILAQSTAGGGGKGGFDVTASVSDGADIGVGVGGGGGSGGDSGAVVLNSWTDVTTQGEHSAGIVAQSTGGGGGHGGFSIAVTGGGSLGVSVGVGGDGGSGGDAKSVTLSSTGDVMTSGDHASAIVGQSTGGGGGNGGFSISADFSGALSVPVSVGGSGGSGGEAQGVTVSSDGNLTTAGVSAHGLFAQSAGGGGGNGGFSIAAGISGAANIPVTVGGSGGDGGSGGAVVANSSGDITTVGNNAHALVAQSLGGGGGNGGFSISGGIAVSPEGAGANIGVSVGGDGGSGDSASTVMVDSTGNLQTSGNSASAIFAQSLGGGGGNGGFSIAGGVAVGEDGGADIEVSVGGSAGSGNTADAVSVTSTGNVQTGGDNSAGIFAQSVGGGGGRGGFSIEGSLSGGSDGVNIGVSVGGSGGSGNSGSTVTVDSTGNVQTGGQNSAAIFAQSVGGGGGDGGFSISANVVATNEGGNVGVSVGGEARGGGDGGQVGVTSMGDLTTSGNNSPGLQAQSVGGSGGNGGFSVEFGGGPQAEIGVSVGGAAGSGGDASTVADQPQVTVSSAGTVTTTGEKSYGIQAQAVGGSGGNGGFSIAGDLTIADGEGGGNVSVSVGGGGGTGGISGIVNLTNTGSVFTEGGGAHGIFAQSVGGGGGAGGFSGAANIAFQGDVDVGVSVGGGGGSGGTASDVTVYSSGAVLDTPGGTIATQGDGAIGLFAQSVGGSGGDGGFSFAANLGVGSGDGQTGNVGVSIGGGGASGGTSGAVDVTNYNNIETDGQQSYGIQAQSIGGGGGNGGLSVSGALALSSENSSNNLNVAVGGEGGEGNNAGEVTVDNAGNIATFGGQARGIFAQSVGGSGGNGGLSFAGTFAGGGSPKDIDISIGGGAGQGGDGDAVKVTNSGSILTGSADVIDPEFPIPGYQAQGIFAQSVGGGGGTGGLAGAAVLSKSGEDTNLNINIGIGGSGGAAGQGDSVEVDNSGAIVTYAVGATGIVAQSVGGGGGVGGSSFAGVVGLTDPSQMDSSADLKFDVDIGGEGGDGGTAGAVTVNNLAGGSITTSGGSAKGIFAQSVGGGGGSGGASDAFSMQIGQCGVCSPPDLTDKDISLDVAVGGNGGTGGDAGPVTVTNNDIIQTAGAGSDAIFAQSIGAGGGIGGTGSLGTSSLIGIPGTVVDDITTIADPPIQFWKSLSFAVGGTAGAAGNGGPVAVTNTATLITTGDTSAGIYAQSVGGGGGQGGTAAGGSFATANIGGGAGAAGDADTVTVNNSGDISTGASSVVDGDVVVTGQTSFGIFAQSVGGGGGQGGSVNAGLLGTSANIGIGVEFAPGGGNGGNAGDVDVSNSAAIATLAEGAHAIWAQSVGGGGGLVGTEGVDVSGLSFAGSNGDDGDAGNVTVTHTGDILTLGDGAAGIFAQSASGGADGETGDGTDDYAQGATGTGGTVDITVNSTIITEGEKSKAIVAQSIGKNGNEDITVVIGADSEVIGGTDMDGFGVGSDPIGVWLLDGKDNSIENSGLITTREGISGTAIYAEASQSNGATIANTVENSGIVTGSVVLADVNGTDATMTSAFDNEITGLFNMGIVVDLGGSPNTLTNKGIVSPGGVNNILTTELNGDFTQTADGAYVVTVDYADNDPNPGNPNEADLINVSGEAELDGFVIVDAINGAFVGPDQSGKVLILNAEGEFGNPTLVANDTEVVNFEISYDTLPTGKQVFLEWIVDFTPSGLNKNETAVANYIVEAIDVGDPLAIDGVINSLLEAPDLDTLRDAYDRLTPEPYIDNQIVTVLSNMQLGRSLMDCHRPQEYDERDRGCVWLRGGGYKAEQTETFDYLGFDETAYLVEAGIGGFIGETAAAVAGFSYTNSDIDTKGRFGRSDIASSSGHRYQGGIGLSNTVNGSTIAVAALGGAAQYEVERYIDLADFSATAEGDQDLYFVGGQVRLAHEATSGVFRFKPLFEAWGGYFHQDEISESGAGGANLDVEAEDDYFLAVRPAVTLALEFVTDEGAVFRPFLTGGATYFAVGNDGDGPSLTATMQGEENLVPGFTVSSALQDYYIDGEAGLTMKAPNGASLRISGSAQYAEDYLSYGGAAKLVTPF